MEQIVKRQKTGHVQENVEKQSLLDKYNYFPFVKVTRIDVDRNNILLTLQNFDKSILTTNPNFAIRNEIVFFRGVGLSAIDDSPKVESAQVFQLPESTELESKLVSSKPFYLLKPLSFGGYVQTLDANSMHAFLCLDEDLTTLFILEIGKAGESIYVIRIDQSEEEYKQDYDNGDSYCVLPYVVPEELKSDPVQKRTVMFSYYCPSEYQTFRQRYPERLVRMYVSFSSLNRTPSLDIFLGENNIPFAFTDGGVMESTPYQLMFLIPFSLKETAKQIVRDHKWGFRIES